MKFVDELLLDYTSIICLLQTQAALLQSSPSLEHHSRQSRTRRLNPIERFGRDLRHRLRRTHTTNPSCEFYWCLQATTDACSLPTSMTLLGSGGARRGRAGIKRLHPCIVA